MLSTVGIYKGELNINPVRKLIVLNEEELAAYLYVTGEGSASKTTGRDLGDVRGGNESVFFTGIPSLHKEELRCWSLMNQKNLAMGRGRWWWWWCSGSNYGSRGIFCQEMSVSQR